MKKLFRGVLLVGLFLSASACSPEVGSEKWCEAMREKPRGDWTANELADYTKHCVFN